MLSDEEKPVLESIFTCVLSKRGRGRGLFTLKNWTQRKVVVSKQELSYYEGEVLRGEVNLNGCSAEILKDDDPDAEGKSFPFVVRLDNGESIIFGAPIVEIRQKMIAICSSASKSPDWAEYQKVESIQEISRATLGLALNTQSGNLDKLIKQTADQLEEEKKSNVLDEFKLKELKLLRAHLIIQRSWATFKRKRAWINANAKKKLAAEVQMDKEVNTYVNDGGESDSEDEADIDFNIIFPSYAKKMQERAVLLKNRDKGALYDDFRSRQQMKRFAVISNKYMPIAYVHMLALVMVYIVFQVFYLVNVIMDNYLSTTFWVFCKILFDIFYHLRIYIEVFVLVSLFYMTCHRFLGWAVTNYLNYLLLMSNGGFNMSIDWASFRLGLDHNEIMIRNFKWHNPPEFNKTPYFLNVKDVIVSFSFISLIKAIFDPRHCDINVYSIQLSHSKCYMEKIKTEELDGLNLWGCLGYESTITKDDDSRKDSLISSLLSKLASAGGQLADVISKYKPGEVVGMMRDSITSICPSLPLSLDDANLNSISRSNSIDDAQSPRSNTSEGCSDRTRGSSMDESASMKEEAVKDLLPPLEYHWGLCYKFFVHRITVIDLELHAQDFLQSTHKDTDNRIIVEIINIMGSRLVQKVGKESKNKKKTKLAGIYLDDLVWRLINEAIFVVLDTNKGALMKIIGSATANNIATGISTTANNIAKGVSDTGNNIAKFLKSDSFKIGASPDNK